MPGRRPPHTTSLVEAASLSMVDLFKGLPESCIAALERQSEVRHYRPGHVFFRAGGTGQRLFLLEKGRVQTFRPSGKNRLIIAELKPPAIFGEMAFVGQCMYHCCAETVQDSTIRFINREQLEDLLEQYPIVTRRLLELVSERFVRVLAELESTSFRQLLPRIAGLIIERAVNGVVQDLTHKEIAEHLRVYRESVTTALGELRKAGIIQVGRKRIHVLDSIRLERASRE